MSDNFKKGCVWLDVEEGILDKEASVCDDGRERIIMMYDMDFFKYIYKFVVKCFL